MRKLLAVLSLLGFATSLFVHLSTYFGLPVARRLPQVWLLHVLIIVVFVPLLIATRRRAKGRDGGTEDAGMDAFFAPMPRWAKYAFYGLTTYACVNFVLYTVGGPRGSACIDEGQYVLRAGGGSGDEEDVRELSQADYDSHQARKLRGFSGHWLVFYLTPALYFRYHRGVEGVDE